MAYTSGQFNTFWSHLVIVCEISNCQLSFTRLTLVGLKISLFKALTDTSRLIAVLVMFLMIILTILAATVWHLGFLALIFCILQFLSYMWYCLSYIPYGRDGVIKCCKSCV